MAVKLSMIKSIPILVDMDFIDHCLRISQEVDKINKEEIIADTGITEEEYNFLAEGNSIDHDSDRYVELHTARSIIQYSSKDFSAHFKDGTVVDSNELDEIIDSIRYSSSECEKMKMRFGVFRFCQLDIDLENKKWPSIYLYIRGKQNSVNHLRAMSKSLFENFAPDHSYLRKSPFWIFVGLSIWLLLSSIYVYGLMNFSQKNLITSSLAAGALAGGITILSFLM